MTKILTPEEIAEKLQCGMATFRKIWKELPHFFVGRGKQESLKSARFIEEDVIEYLRTRDYTNIAHSILFLKNRENYYEQEQNDM